MMQKKNFVTMIMGTVSGLAFALGMCMALLPAWELTTAGIAVGAAGIVGGMITWLTNRKMNGKPLVAFNLRQTRTTLFGIAAALVLGVGMVMTMVWGMMVIGIVVGIVGIAMILGLIPMVKGFAKEVE